MTEMAHQPMEKVVNFVTVEAKVLSKAMKIATAIVEPRNTIPILSAVRLNYDRKGLVIEATDLDMTARIEVDEIDGDGTWSICLIARDLAAIAAAAGTAPLRIETISDPDAKPTAVLSAGEATYNVQAYSPSDFPEIDGQRMQRVEKFTNGQLAAMFKKVAFCISTEETRYYLNGINWAAKPDGKRFAATDGHRLALCRYSANENEATFSYIIPRKTVSIVSQFMDGADIEIFSVGKGNTIVDTLLELKGPGVALRTKLIDGTYPDIDRVIPNKENHRLNVRRDEMLTAIRQATAIGAWRGAAIRLRGISGRMRVETKNPDFGTADVCTSAAWPEGAPECGVNSRYLTEMVRNCQGDIRFGMADAGAPLTLSDDDKDMTRLLMPMRV
ncbi:DNA polymerase III subunit beta [Rhizobium sp. PL01]|uniref:DNA polymerase III subunit beta n=1 Tax=Rhizobium sp. PL01 TaxID=3085631 RepID=UPI002982A52E|nr:DNA polymerase III subunit beta [Rhizobium sp. PL01]